MHERLSYVTEQAKKEPQHILLCESDDVRVREAAARVAREGMARISFVSCRKETAQGHCACVPMEKSPHAGRLVSRFHELRKHKNMSGEEAEACVKGNPLYFSAMMVREGLADGFVAGASYPTREVIRAALHCMGVNRTVKTVSGAFLIFSRTTRCGDNGFFIFSDCAVTPFPGPSQLVRIATSAATLMRELYDAEARIAFLTYSTRGSAEGDSVDAVRRAARIMRETHPDIQSDGELQFDAAVIPEVQKRKAPDSPLGGRANVLIFPSLDAGNITYKALERLGGVQAVGPTLLGIEGACSDLSRGCSVDDIVYTIALTGVRAAERKKRSGMR